MIGEVVWCAVFRLEGVNCKESRQGIGGVWVGKKGWDSYYGAAIFSFPLFLNWTHGEKISNLVEDVLALFRAAVERKGPQWLDERVRSMFPQLPTGAVDLGPRRASSQAAVQAVPGEPQSGPSGACCEAPATFCLQVR